MKQISRRGTVGNLRLIRITSVIRNFNRKDENLETQNFDLQPDSISQFGKFFNVCVSVLNFLCSFTKMS
ncbi:hypothetical protein B2G50_19600 [Leptospira interrogans serovar Canicola]|nr:hypothetical protein B2G50_19600 [Leptospira interrogans serovar Canicola]